MQSNAENVHNVRNLVTLDISENHIGDEGANALAACIDRMTGLEVLNLSGNKISSHGAESLQKYAAHLGRLKRLDMRGNNMDQATATTLVAVLPNVVTSTLS